MLYNKKLKIEYYLRSHGLNVHSIIQFLFTFVLTFYFLIKLQLKVLKLFFYTIYSTSHPLETDVQWQADTQACGYSAQKHITYITTLISKHAHRIWYTNSQWHSNTHSTYTFIAPAYTLITHYCGRYYEFQSCKTVNASTERSLEWHMLYCGKQCTFTNLNILCNILIHTVRQHLVWSF